MNLKTFTFKLLIFNNYLSKNNLIKLNSHSKFYSFKHFNKAQIFNEQTRFLSSVVPSIIKKRPVKKKKSIIFSNVEGFQVTAFNTAEEYNLESINLDINKFLKYMPSEFNSEFESKFPLLCLIIFKI